MNTTLEEFSNLPIQEKVSCFKNTFGEFKKNKENEKFFDILQKELMIETYSLPSHTKMIASSEASGFLEYAIGYFPDLVNSYRSTKGSSWINFFISFMIKRFINYKKNKKLADKKEQIILNSHVSYEYVQRTEDTANEFDLVTENSNSNKLSETARKLIYIFKKCPTTRRRFFIFLVASSTVIDPLMLSSICKMFNFDARETLEVIARCVGDKDYSRIERRRDTIQGRRNFNYSQALIYRDKYCCSSDYYVKQKYNDKHITNLQRLDDRNIELSKISTKANQNKIASVLGLKRGTISSSISHTKQMLEYCIDEDSHDAYELFPEKLASSLVSGKWFKEQKRLRPLTIFFPSEVFTIM